MIKLRNVTRVGHGYWFLKLEARRQHLESRHTHMLIYSQLVTWDSKHEFTLLQDMNEEGAQGRERRAVLG
jgi:hypothetical protein